MVDNASLAFDPTHNPDEDTVLTIKKLDLNFNPGFPTGAIELSATSETRSLTVNFKGEAGLVLKEIGRDRYGQTIAKFGIDILALEPDLKWGFFSIGLRGYASELLTTGTAIALTKSLDVFMPLPDKPDFNLSVDRKERVPVRDPESENWVEIAAKFSLGKLEEEYSFGYPVFINGGLWFGAEIRTGGQAPLELVDRGNRTDAELDNEITNLKTELEAIPDPDTGTGDVAVWLKGQALEQTVAKFASLPTDRRTATIASTAYQGKLANKEWSDDILGKGGAFVEFSKPDAVKATATIDSLNATWEEGIGLRVAARLTLKGKGDVHVHVDPLIGGGAGTDVAIVGETTADIAGKLPVTVVKLNDSTVLAVMPDVACNPVVIEAKTDGKLVLDVGWTKVPQIGAKVSIPGVASILSPQMFLSDLPYVIGGRTEKGNPLPVSFSGRDFLFTPAWQSALIAVQPIAASTSADGMLISASLAVTPSADRTVAANRDKAEAELKAAFADTYKPNECAGDLGIAVLLGDVEIGPNNEIIKFLRNAWNDITKGPGKNNEAVKILRAATDAMVKANEPFDEATQKAADEINGLAKTAFGEDSVAAQGVEAVIDIMRPPSVGKNENGGVTVSGGGVSASTGGGHGGLGVSVDTPIGGVKF